MNGRIVVVKPEDWDKPVKTVLLDVVREHVKESGTDWVMISGGEPTLTPAKKLNNLMEEIKSWGCKIGISTNGTYPENLKNILPSLNYVAMDLKSDSPELYDKIDVKHDDSFSRMIQSKCMLYKERCDRDDFQYEVRTTLYPEFFNIDSVSKIAGIIRPDEHWVFQQFRHAKNMLNHEEALSVKPYTEDHVKEIVQEAEKHCDNVHVRYV